MVDKLRERFVALVDRLAPPTPSTRAMAIGWFGVLAGLYTESHRHYHGLGHIENLLGRLDELGQRGSIAGLDRLLETEVAIWFHDAVYVVGSPDNEATSALLARAFLFSLQAQHDEADRTPFVDKVQAAIMATKHDGREPEGNAARVMVDLDLAGFADPWEEFEENNQRIRQEYASVPWGMYRLGRLSFLTKLLLRPIFHVLTELEAPARANIERHIADLVATSEEPAR